MMAMVLRRLWAAMAAGALLSAPLGLTACGEGGGARTATVAPGDMPSGAKWDGVYFSELYGFLHLKQGGGNAIKGRWERKTKDKWGELKGEITGDVIKFEWFELTQGLVGPNAKHTGRGYFKYKRPAGDNVDDTIAGEIGPGQDEVGEPWEAIKQRNIPPNLESIGGTGASDVGGGDWDPDSKEKGKPEGPASPR
jgi:hypothetical protein